MAVVTTMPEKGGSTKAYEIPDEELSKYQQVEAQKTQYDETPEGAEKGSDNELGGALDMQQLGDVQAYHHICICWYRIRHRWYYRYVYCWEYC